MTRPWQPSPFFIFCPREVPRFFEYRVWRRQQMPTTSKCSQLLMAGACLAFVFTIGAAAWPETHTFDITLTGQSMIRSDIRVYAPSAMSTITQLLKGDVIFTNLEATVSPLPLQGRRPTPPEAL